MSELQKGKKDKGQHGPAFSVQDEIRRDRSLQRTSRRRSTPACGAPAAHFFDLRCSLRCVDLRRYGFYDACRHDHGQRQYSVFRGADHCRLGDRNGRFPAVSSIWSGIYRNIVSVYTHISKIELSKNYPSSVEIIVLETGAVYAVQVRDRWLTLDGDLRVIEYTEDISDLIVLTLPAVQQAVEGMPLVFADAEAAAFVNASLPAVIEGTEAFRFNRIDLSDKYNVRIWVNGDAEILLGDAGDIAIKLQLAGKVYKDAVAAGSFYTVIDVSDPARISAAYDAEVER